MKKLRQAIHETENSKRFKETAEFLSQKNEQETYFSSIQLKIRVASMIAISQKRSRERFRGTYLSSWWIFKYIDKSKFPIMESFWSWFKRFKDIFGVRATLKGNKVKDR